MKSCIYCNQPKEDGEFSLEHAIPQFLGGAYVSEKYKTRDVCKECNNILGLFVDAAFEKDFSVYNNLKNSAYAFFDPALSSALPLQCFGISKLIPPRIEETEVCEYWLGPFGEQIFLIRPKDERLFWFSGGNPIALKKKESRAYIMFSINSVKDMSISLSSLMEAFASTKKLKKIICTPHEGDDPTQFGFSKPDDIDLERIEFFNNAANDGKVQNNSIPINPCFDHRFLAKLAIGVAHCLFGEKIQNSTYMQELRKGLWYKDGDPTPQVPGVSAYGNDSSGIKHLVGMKNVVTICILKLKWQIILNLNINQSLNWSVQIADTSELDEEDIKKIGDEGISIVLVKPLMKAIEIPFVDFMAHITGQMHNSKISEIEKKVDKSKEYLDQIFLND